METKPALIIAVLLFSMYVTTGVQAQTQQHEAPKVVVANGELEGINDAGVMTFKGVPFAKPPVGDLRWRPPQPVDDWDGVRSAQKFGPRCMQRPVFGDMVFRSDGMNEDCLYLNIWSPTVEADADLPVLVYFYGGGFVAGDGSEPRYDGESMARNKGIVTVTVNYRLNVFGFMAHPELTDESSQSASGNYGLLDQAAALRWVKENIASFGGDPNNITIAGESAGSVSVSAQMASPLSRDLIAGAVGESGSIIGALSAVPLEQAEKTGVSYQQKMGASSLKELRAMDAQTVLDSTASQGVPGFSPTVDGYFFPKNPVEIFRAGEQADIPLLLGWNSQEMSYQFLMQGKEPTPGNFEAIVKQLYGENAQRILELYPASTKEETIQSATALAADRFIAFSTWKWSDLHSETSSSPVYRYFYARPRPEMRESAADENTPPPASGAVHAAEIEYVMGNLPHNRVYNWQPEDFEVSNIFQGFVANFVKSKDPNGLGLPTWQPLDWSDTRHVMQIDADTHLRPVNERPRYEFLDTLANPEQ